MNGLGFISFFVFSCLLLFAVNDVFFFNLGYLTALMYYSFILLWMLIGYRLTLREAVFHLLIIFMCDHCLKQIFSNLIWMPYWQQFPNLLNHPLLMSLVQAGIWTAHALVCSLLLLTVRKHILLSNAKDLNWNRILLMLPAVIPVLYISYMLLNLEHDPWTTVLLIEAVSSFCGLILIISQEKSYLAGVYQLEIANLENAMQSQYDRYLISTEAAEQINQACHDFKNQLIAFREDNCNSQEEDYVRELEKTMNKYRAVYHTGNSVLDGVLYEKGRLAEAASAQLLCFADGNLLTRLRPVDLCTLVGNLLDNAIEACANIENLTDRSVILKITQFRHYALIRCENPFRGSLRQEGAAFLTTKQNTHTHGYGLKGIQHVVETYAGGMTVETEGARFILSILIPLAGEDSPIADHTIKTTF